MRYRIYWANGDREIIQADLETYAVMKLLERRGEIEIFNGKETLNLKDNETKLIIKAMTLTGGHQEKAAKLLGISPRALCYKLANLRKNN